MGFNSGFKGLSPKVHLMPMACREICISRYKGCHWMAILHTSHTSGTPYGDNADIIAGKGKGGRFLALNTYRGSRGIAPLILNPGARWKWVVNATPPAASLNRRLGGPQSGCGGSEKR
jgi:hypothetical protein